MSTTTDLTLERLAELERKYKPNYPAVYIDNKTARSLIAMARAKQAAERERDELRTAMGIIWRLSCLPFSDSDRYTLRNIALAYAEGEPASGSQVAQWITALAQSTDAGGA